MHPSQSQNPTNQPVVKSLHSDGPHANPNHSKQASASTAQPIDALSESGRNRSQIQQRAAHQVLRQDMNETPTINYSSTSKKDTFEKLGVE